MLTVNFDSHAHNIPATQCFLINFDEIWIRDSGRDETMLRCDFDSMDPVGCSSKINKHHKTEFPDRFLWKRYKTDELYICSDSRNKSAMYLNLEKTSTKAKKN